MEQNTVGTPDVFVGEDEEVPQIPFSLKTVGTFGLSLNEKMERAR